MPRVTFLPCEISLEVPRGTSLLAAADEAAEMVSDDFFVGELCEGRHECGNCVVEIVRGAENLSPQTASEAALLKELGRGPAFRSSCTARVQGDVTVRIIAPVRHDEGEKSAQMQAHP
jgi:ferredoxin